MVDMWGKVVKLGGKWDERLLRKFMFIIKIK